MRSIFPLALGLALTYLAPVASAEAQSLREECTRDRCVYYKGSQRIFSVEKEQGTTRLVVRDGKRRPIAKVRRQERGRIEVEEPNR